MSADLHHLYVAADRISHHASHIRISAHRLGATVAALHWQGAAARSFRGSAHGVVRDLLHAAGRLDDAADALRRHAATAERELVAAAQTILDSLHAGHDALGFVSDVFTDPGDLLHDAAGLLRDGGHLLHDAGSLLTGDVGTVTGTVHLPELVGGR